MKPDYDRAATKALETLINYNVTATPVLSVPILKKMPNVLVMSFSEMGNTLGIERHKMVTLFGANNQDAVTSVSMINGKPHYVIAYNQLLPMILLHRAMARELGHIVLGHDGSRPEEVRLAEVTCFAYNLMCPRPLIRMMQSTCVRITTDVLSNVTGCNEHCLSGMRKLPPVHTDPALNAKVRDQFFDYFKNFFEFQRAAARYDGSALVDFGRYMEGYEE